MLLGELRNNINTIPINKPIVVYCAGGYRNAAGSSLKHSSLGNKVEVFDLNEKVKEIINVGNVNM